MKKTVIFLSLLFTSSLSFAYHSCAGKVGKVGVSSQGWVHVNIDGIGVGNRLCSLNSKEGGYTPEACQTVFSLALSAKVADKNLKLYFNNDADKSCPKGNWKTLTSEAYQLYYVLIEN